MSNDEYIFNLLINKGFSTAGACAILGNMSAESGVESDRLQGDFSADRSKSKQYVADVDSGKISRAEFATAGPNGGGFGLCQWTFPARKYNLYDYCKSIGASIGNAAAQVAFLEKEMRTEYSNVYKACCADNLVNACRLVLLNYENPANASAQIAYRYNLALGFYDAYKGYVPAEQVQAPAEEQTPATATQFDYSGWPILSQKKFGNAANPYVLMVQTILYGYGYACERTGIYDDNMAACVKAFQYECGIDVDGLCGPKTYDKLLHIE